MARMLESNCNMQEDRKSSGKVIQTTKEQRWVTNTVLHAQEELAGHQLDTTTNYTDIAKTKQGGMLCYQVESSLTTGAFVLILS